MFSLVSFDSTVPQATRELVMDSVVKSVRVMDIQMFVTRKMALAL